MSTSDPSVEQVKAVMRATWMAGDFGMLAKNMTRSAEAFVHSLDLPPASRVLDVACGTGNLAIPLARLGHHVTGVDFAPNLLVQARERAAAEGLTAAFDEGDAEQLPYPDNSFNAVVSMFGAMFAPRPYLVVSEFARVLQPGGILAMANWTPSGFSGEMFRVTGRHAPSPPGMDPPVLWGDLPTVQRRLGSAFQHVEAHPVSIDFDMPMSPAGVVDFFLQYFGPTEVAYRRLDEPGRKALTSDLVALWTGANTATDPVNHTLVPNEYLCVTALCM